MSLQAIETELLHIVSTQDYGRRLQQPSDSREGGLRSSINILLADIEQQRAQMNARLSELADARDDAETANRLLKKLKEQLHQRGAALDQALHKAASASSAKSQFLANMSHEIRTPMNGILGMAELLNRSKLNEKQSQQVATIINSGRSLLTIINDILDFSKVESGKLELDNKPFDLFLCLNDIVELLRPAATRKGLELRLDLDAALPRTYVGDAGRVRQIIMNLAGNAVKFTEEGAVSLRLTGRCNGSDADLKIEVIDTGIGIPPEQLATVFEKFSQADNSGTRRHEGTGLGLSICQHLLARMGSTVSVASDVGIGSNFSFSLTLPVHRGSANADTAAVALKGLRILLSGEPAFIQMASTALEAEDCVITRNGVGRRKRDADVIVIAAGAIDSTVLQTIATFRKPALARKVPIIAIIRHGAPGDAQIVADAHVQAYLTGEINPDDIREVVKAVVGQYHSAGPAIGKQDGQVAPALITRHSLAEARVRVTPSHQLSSIGSTAGRRILVVDDSIVNQEIACEFLADLACEIDVVGDGKAAVLATAGVAFDLILMDCQMPVMDGYQATHAIRTNRTSATSHNVPIIALTANAFASDREKCLAAGMSDFISKPFLPDDFTDTVSRWLTSTIAHAGSPALARA